MWWSLSLPLCVSCVSDSLPVPVCVVPGFSFWLASALFSLSLSLSLSSSFHLLLSSPALSPLPPPIGVRRSAESPRNSPHPNASGGAYGKSGAMRVRDGSGGAAAAVAAVAAVAIAAGTVRWWWPWCWWFWWWWCCSCCLHCCLSIPAPACAGTTMHSGVLPAPHVRARVEVPPNSLSPQACVFLSRLLQRGEPSTTGLMEVVEVAAAAVTRASTPWRRCRRTTQAAATVATSITVVVALTPMVETPMAGTTAVVVVAVVLVVAVTTVATEATATGGTLGRYQPRTKSPPTPPWPCACRMPLTTRRGRCRCQCIPRCSSSFRGNSSNSSSSSSHSMCWRQTTSRDSTRLSGRASTPSCKHPFSSRSGGW